MLNPPQAAASHEADALPADAPFTAFERIAGDPSRGMLILCDHASSAMPPGYGTLGLDGAQLARHIAYDIGAAAVTRALAAHLGVPAILSTFSRLFIDPNRGIDDPTLVMRLSDGAVIPGNRDIDAEEKARRIARAYAPYHAAIDTAIMQAMEAGQPPALLSIHSFTPFWKDAARPWHATVLWDRDPRFARPLLHALDAEDDLFVAENEPYAGRLEGDCMHRHGTKRQLPHALIELRQDLISDDAGQGAWAERLARIVGDLLAEPAFCEALHDPAAAGVITPNTQVYRSADMSAGHDAAETPQATLAGIDDTRQQELEAAAFRRLVAHLQTRTDVQNIDLMTLSGFCRNCLSNWLVDAAAEADTTLSKEDARAHVYGMPYPEWKAQHQTEATPEQIAALKAAEARHGHS
ncbi:MAG: DUF1244 domain-containing protein [Pseudomonadota bacterium]